MDNSQSDDDLDKLKNLLKLLETELNSFQSLIRDMSRINSPYKNNFNYIKILGNAGKQVSTQADFEKAINSIIEEFTNFSELLEKITLDDENRDLYVDNGLLDRCLALQKDFAQKINIKINN